MNKAYKYKIPIQENPKLKLVDIEEELIDDKLLYIIRKRKEFFKKWKLGNKRHSIKKNILAKFIPTIKYNPITHENKLVCWFTSCRMFDYVSVFRCYCCKSFGI